MTKLILKSHSFEYPFSTNRNPGSARKGYIAVCSHVLYTKGNVFQSDDLLAQINCAFAAM